MSEACNLGGEILLDFNGKYPSQSSGELPIIKVPSGVTLDPSIFVITNLPVRVGLDFQVKTLGDGSQVLYTPVASIPARPSAYDASTGYVVQSTADINSGTVPYYSFSDGTNWSDKTNPHSGTNYYTAKTMRVRYGTVTFKGDRLVSGFYIRCEGGADITVNDFWLTPKTSGDPNLITSVGNGSYTIRGKTTFFTTLDRPFSFDQTKEDNGVTLASKLVASTDAAFRFAGGDNHVYLAMTGDTSEFYGTAIAYANGEVRLGTNGLAHGVLCFRDASSSLTTTADGAGLVTVAELTATNGGTVTAANANVLSLGQLTLGGTLTKAGTGALAVKTSVGAADAQLAVDAGAVRALGPEAFRDITLVFGTNGSVLRDATDAAVAETGLLTAKTVTCGDTLSVRVVAAEPDGDRVAQDVVLMTVPSAQAETLAGKLRVRAKGYRAGEIVISDEDAAGLKTLSTHLELSGMVMIVR